MRGTGRGRHVRSGASLEGRRVTTHWEREEQLRAQYPGPAVDCDPIETLARRLGFGTGETPRRAFHRHAGVAPSDYRDRFRGTREYA